jgi:hypothetical protein
VWGPVDTSAIGFLWKSLQSLVPALVAGKFVGNMRRTGNGFGVTLVIHRVLHKRLKVHVIIQDGLNKDQRLNSRKDGRAMLANTIHMLPSHHRNPI